MASQFNPQLGRVQIQHETKKLEIGWMGRLFGSVAEKPGNIAGFAIVVFSAMFGGVLIWGVDTASMSKKDCLVLIGGFISLTLGFIFGRSTSN
jgi:hypothetical protein